jgi:hypothetical protein
MLSQAGNVRWTFPAWLLLLRPPMLGVAILAMAAPNKDPQPNNTVRRKLD